MVSDQYRSTTSWNITFYIFPYVLKGPGSSWKLLGRPPMYMCSSSSSWSRCLCYRLLQRTRIYWLPYLQWHIITSLQGRWSNLSGIYDFVNVTVKHIYISWIIFGLIWDVQLCKDCVSDRNIAESLPIWVMGWERRSILVHKCWCISNHCWLRIYRRIMWIPWWKSN